VDSDFHHSRALHQNAEPFDDFQQPCGDYCDPALDFHIPSGSAEACWVPCLCPFHVHRMLHLAWLTEELTADHPVASFLLGSPLDDRRVTRDVLPDVRSFQRQCR